MFRSKSAPSYAPSDFLSQAQSDIVNIEDSISQVDLRDDTISRQELRIMNKSNIDRIRPYLIRSHVITVITVPILILIPHCWKEFPGRKLCKSNFYEISSISHLNRFMTNK